MKKTAATSRGAASLAPLGAGLTGLAAMLFANSAQALDNQYNFQTPVTAVADNILDLHMGMFWVCVGIFVAVFSVMFWSIWKHRKSRGAVPATFHESVTVEIAWTIIPVVILLVMAWPATKAVINQKDTSSPDITIKATGYQWKWGYDYVQGEGQGVSFFSTLSTPRAQIDRGEWKGENYLLEVDKPVYVPIGKKVRILTTAQDVIHAWWIPAFGVKQDAIPGVVRDTWFRAEKEGIYRGNCVELCGKDHGFMPIVVHVVSDKAYSAWVQQQKAGNPVSAPAIANAQAAALPVSIYFDTGKASIASESQAAIKAASEYLAANADQKIDITGYTDKTGSLDKNKELAKERAKAVREALKAAGVAAERIIMKPPAQVTDGGDGKAGRRVDISPSTAAAS